MAVSGGTRRELEPGDTLGGYKLEESLGEGGMGLVFRALRAEDGREVALKVLKIELAGDLVFQHRFRQEARAAAEVHDPHLVPIIEAAEADGRHYLAVDYVPGGSLGDRITQSTRSASTSSSRSSPRSPPGSTRFTARASSTATSSPRTSCLAPTGRRC